MKYLAILSILVGVIGFSGMLPQSYGDNEFCNIQENLKNQEELIEDDIVLVEFLKVFPNAKLIRASSIDDSNPEQTSMTWTTGIYYLDIHILGFDEDHPSNCFVPVGYRLNAPHLPKMVGLDYHKDFKIVLEQIEELKFNYIEDGSIPIITPPIKQFKSGTPVDEIKCKYNLVLIQKYNGLPACVTLETKPQLIERGWAKPT